MYNNRNMADEEEVYETCFDEDFVEPLSDAHKCPICLSALNSPMQTTCGHRFCKGCIMKVVREGRACCPIDCTPIGVKDLHSDVFAKREISQLQVCCRFQRSSDCSWVGTLGKLKEHLDFECEFALEDCRNQCGEQLSKKNLEDHLKNECSKRIVACLYCGVKLIARRVPDHYESCMKVMVPCPNGCNQADIMRENLRYHYEKCTKNCFFRNIGCMFEGTNKDIDKHMAESLQAHLLLLAREIRSVEREFSDLKCELKNEDRRVGAEMSHFSTEELVQVRRQLEDIDLRTSKSRDLIGEYRGETTNKNKELDIRIEDLRRHINKNTNMITYLNSKICNGHFIWRIPNFEALFQDAKSGKTPALHSIPFYSSIPGYRMCLRLNLNGISSGLNTHISMFVHFMQGDYDSIVTWPFNGSFKFKVMQQDPSTGQPRHIEETLTSRPTLQAFSRPMTERNRKGYGHVEMVSHEILYNQGYVKEDALIVSVEVTSGNATQRSEGVEDAEHTTGYEMNPPHSGCCQLECEF